MPFKINAKSCTLMGASQQGNPMLLAEGSQFVIPIYQRPYSWNEEQVQKFVADIFVSFWGNDKKSAQDSFFIGTMQLTYKTDQPTQEIIDGQQRLTTLLLLLKVLKVKFPQNTELQNLKLDWIKTKVNNGMQQKWLDEALASSLVFERNTQNPYLHNLQLISELFDEKTSEDLHDIRFDVTAFVNHLLGNIYFVVVETMAGLTKTLQIFKAINTTGLDLNGGDIFKIRMYEYLNQNGDNDSAFEEISRLYASIDALNAKQGYAVVNINDVLAIYQYILIAKYDLPLALYNFATDTFYEQLFDSLLHNYQWEHFKQTTDCVKLTISDLERIIEARFDWENNWFHSGEDMCAFKLIQHSRYGKYADLVPVILSYSNSSLDRFSLVKLLSKVYFIFSVRFQKSIYHIHSITNEIIQDIVLGKSNESIEFKLLHLIGDRKSHNTGYYDLDWFLSENLTENLKRKNLICRLSAMLEEEYQTTDVKKIEELKSKLFDSDTDVEHIQSYHDQDEKIRQEVWDEWQNELDSIGNLVILERSINRSIRNNHFFHKRQVYAKSSFNILQNLSLQFAKWDLETCKDRKLKELIKITNYLFS